MQAQVVGIVGPPANGWPDDDNPTPDIMLTDNGDGTHSIDELTLTDGLVLFRENQDWTVFYGGDTFPSGPVTDGNIPVQAGVYDIVLDLSDPNNLNYTFTNAGNFTEIELIGSAVPASTEMTTIDGINYKLNVTQFNSGNVQFQEVGTTTQYGANSFPTGTATMDGMDIPVPFGFYEVTFNLNTGEYAFDIPVVGIIGDAADGWPDDTTDTDIPMNSSDGDVYFLNSQDLTDGFLLFRQNFDWSVFWGGTDFPSGLAQPNINGGIAITAGTYDVNFFRDNLTYTFTTLSVDDQSFEQFSLHPNPTKNVWIFENPSIQIENIYIYNSFGKLIFETKPYSTKGKVSAQTFSQGLYLAKIRLINGSETTVKMIKN